MKWPFTSRALLDEKQRQIEELKEQILTLQAKNEDLYNQIVWRHSNIAIDPNRLPEQYRPRAVAPTTAPSAEDKTNRPTIVGSGPKRAREFIRQAEQKSEIEFRRQQGIEVPHEETERDRAAQLEVITKLSQAADEAVKPA